MKRLKWALLLLLLMTLAAGCSKMIEVRVLGTPTWESPTLSPTPAADVGATVDAAVRATVTAVAQTLVAQTPEATPSPTSSRVVATPSSTPALQPTSTARLSSPKSPTRTPRPPTPTPTTEPEPTRIQFAPAATSATVTGRMEPHGSKLYVLRALAGQTMEVVVTTTPGDGVGLSIWGADGTVLKRYVDETPEWRGELPSTQDYFIHLISIQETSYTLTVTIPPLLLEPSIQVISPNGREVWAEGSTHDIVWDSSGVEKVDIGVASGGKNLGLVASGVDAESGRYSWEIPVGLISNFGIPQSNSMRARVSDSEDPSIYDENDNHFTIMCPRIQFEPGATSATVTGHIEQQGVDRYVLRAFAGQTMEVVITSPNNDVLLTIVEADGIPLKKYVDGLAEWCGKLPSTQDYFIEAVSVGGATNYELTVWISALSLPKPIRIQFEPGATSTVIEGSLAPGIPDRYVLRARRGQSMEVHVSTTASVDIAVEGQDGLFWSAPSSEGTLRIGELPATQDYIITLSPPLPLAGTMSYGMEVRIPAP